CARTLSAGIVIAPGFDFW
nr:immunoglobulin heavy chain junction region [Macaca mulatta]MOV46016.1 immunoglobulin heavy chain junction region [Macaca mulatta]